MPSKRTAPLRFGLEQPAPDARGCGPGLGLRARRMDLVLRPDEPDGASRARRGLNAKTVKAHDRRLCFRALHTGRSVSEAARHPRMVWCGC